MFLPKLREIKEALSSLFSNPITTKYPEEAYSPIKEYRGFPEYDENDCMGCGACYQVCPADAIELEDNRDNGYRKLTVDYFSCVNCGQCEEHCPVDTGIVCKSNYSFSSPNKQDRSHFDTVEKQMVKCQICDEYFICKDQLDYVRKELGARAFAHPDLLLEFQEQFIKTPESTVKSKVRREDYMKNLCPECRHKVVVEDEFK